MYKSIEYRLEKLEAAKFASFGYILLPLVTFGYVNFGSFGYRYI